MADHFRNAWRCERVQIVQEAPKRISVRGMRADPLARPTGPETAPAGTFERPDLRRLYLGRDAAGDHRWLPLSRQTTGVTLAGLPGMGKSSLTNSWLCQTAGTSAVQYAIADGKGGGDWEPWRSRAWLFSGDELADAVTMLEDVHAEMRMRLSTVVERTGHRNAWAAGPSEDFPLIIWVLDETQTWLDVAAMRGDPKREALARRAIRFASEIIRKSGSVMMLGILATQKPTGDSLPVTCRDNCALSVSFGLRTTEGAVAALGEGIRTFASYSPLLLRDPGVCVATLPTGSDPYALLRVPEVTEAMADQRAASTASYRREEWPAQAADRLAVLRHAVAEAPADDPVSA